LVSKNFLIFVKFIGIHFRFQSIPKFFRNINPLNSLLLTDMLHTLNMILGVLLAIIFMCISVDRDYFNGHFFFHSPLLIVSYYAISLSSTYNSLP
jgi:hypothetical protein